MRTSQPETHMKESLLRSVLILIILSTSLSAVACRKELIATPCVAEKFVVFADAFSQYYPSISGYNVVWQDNRSGNFEIYGHNLQTETGFTIHTNESSICMTAISGDIFIWNDWRDDGSYNDSVTSWADWNYNGSYPESVIYGYNLSSGQKFSIPGVKECEELSGDIILWTDGPNVDIYGYNLSSGEELSFHTYPPSLLSPYRLSPAASGNIVVWTDYRNDNGDIYGYHLDTKEEFAICTDPHEQKRPDVSGDTVIWLDYRNDTPAIYGYNLSSGKEFVICTTAEGYSHPVISGDIIVWHDNRDGDGDIYGYNLNTREEFAICTDPHEQERPFISGDTVIWLDLRNGNWDIYGARLTFDNP